MDGHPPFPLRLDLKDPKYLELRLRVDIKKLKYFSRRKDSHVKPLTLIQNKNGKQKERIVFNPSEPYKEILRRINRAFLQRAVLPPGVLGGVIGKSIDNMAEVHCGQEAVFSIDLKNFFPGIDSGRIFTFFQKTGCTCDVAGILTDLVTLNHALPQGFPTSPMLANLMAYGLDCQHLEQCKAFHIRRTRWIDDIVFSGRSAILKKCTPKFVGAIKHHGFTLNESKTAFTARSNIPEIVGLAVAGKTPHLPQAVIDKIISILTECKVSGVAVIQANYECDAFGWIKNLKPSLEGRVKRVEQYGHKEAVLMRELFDAIDWDEPFRVILAACNEMKEGEAL
jgi:hypothetical protein